MVRTLIIAAAGFLFGALAVLLILRSSVPTEAYAQTPAREAGRWQVLQGQYVEETRGKGTLVERLLLLDTLTGDVYRYQYYADDKGEAIGWYYMGERKR